MFFAVDGALTRDMGRRFVVLVALDMDEQKNYWRTCQAGHEFNNYSDMAAGKPYNKTGLERKSGRFPQEEFRRVK